MQYSVHPPTPFIERHWQVLLPDWSQNVGSVLITLQYAACNLTDRSERTEAQKYLLRERFLEWSQGIAIHLHQMGFLADPFDPKTGQPIFSKPGAALDDVAVIHACLGYPKIQINQCSIIWHPDWGSAVYPAVVLSSARPDVMIGVVYSIRGTGGSLESNSVWRTRSEYHHSFNG